MATFAISKNVFKTMLFKDVYPNKKALFEFSPDLKNGPYIKINEFLLKIRENISFVIKCYSF